MAPEAANNRGVALQKVTDRGQDVWRGDITLHYGAAICGGSFQISIDVGFVTGTREWSVNER